jgi:hypothetical protein
MSTLLTKTVIFVGAKDYLIGSGIAGTEEEGNK